MRNSYETDITDSRDTLYARGNWMIEDSTDSRSFSDPIPTKREAFEALVEWQEQAAKQDAAREAERAAIRASRR